MKGFPVTRLFFIALFLCGATACSEGPSNGVDLSEVTTHTAETPSSAGPTDPAVPPPTAQNNQESPPASVTNEGSTSGTGGSTTPDTGSSTTPSVAAPDENSKKSVRRAFSKEIVAEMKEAIDETEDPATTPPHEPTCGDNTCDAGIENYVNCPQDCHTGGGGGGSGRGPIRHKMEAAF